MKSLEQYKKIQKVFRYIIMAILFASFIFEKGSQGREILNNSVRVILPLYLVFQFIYLYRIKDQL